jgi:PII-like signaling protein
VAAQERGGTAVTPEEVPALRVTVLVGEGDLVGHRPLYSEIVHRAHAAGLRGASVFRGIEGFGRGSAIHTDRLLDLSGELPVAVVVVDTADRIRAFLAGHPELWRTGLVTVEAVGVVAVPGEEGAG